MEMYYVNSTTVYILGLNAENTHELSWKLHETPRNMFIGILHPEKTTVHTFHGETKRVEATFCPLNLLTELSSFE